MLTIQVMPNLSATQPTSAPPGCAVRGCLILPPSAGRSQDLRGPCPDRTTGPRQRCRRARAGAGRKAARRLRLRDEEREDRRHRHGCRTRATPSARPDDARRLTVYDGSIATLVRPSRRSAALAALKASDRKIARLIETTEPIDPGAWRKARPVGDPFSVLIYSIIGQQISGFAARAIAGRLQERFAERMPSPAELLAMDPADLKSVGLSQRKVEYVRSLADHVVAGELKIGQLHKILGAEGRGRMIATPD